MTAIRVLPRVVLLLMTLLVLGPLPAGSSCDEIDPLEVLPADEACPGWVRDGDPLTAYSVEELTLIINGGAFLYAQYGFIAAAFQNYAGEVAGEPASLTLAVFNQGTAENAAALYHDPNSGSGDPVTDWTGTGEARFREDLLSVTFQFWEACFFVSVIVAVSGEDAILEARCMAEQVVARIQAPSPTKRESWGSMRITYR